MSRAKPIRIVDLIVVDFILAIELLLQVSTITLSIETQ